MGKKGNWLSALKRAFTPSSKDNIIQNTEKKYEKEKKKWGAARSKHTEVGSFIPLCREPSSIEKILGEADRDLQHRIEPVKKAQHFPSTNEDPQRRIQQLHSPNDQEQHKKSPRWQHAPLRQEPPKKFQRPKPGNTSHRRAFNPGHAHNSAVRIQAAFRGYIARKNYRALKGLVRLQRVMRGQNIKRQTTNTMKCMQLLVRVQSQVRTRRLQMIESRSHQNQHQITAGMSEREMEASFGRWSLAPHVQSGVEGDEDWDDSVLTKDERDARMKRKVEAVIKRERALAYAYSHQLLKVTPKSAHAVLTDIRSGGYPWWWSWLDRQLGHEPHQTPLPKTPIPLTPKFTSTATNFRPSSQSQPKRDIVDISTPRSSKALPSLKTKNSSNRWNQIQFRDDNSLTSCPAFRPVPNYMVPTVSAKAKVRDTQPGTRDCNVGGEKKGFSFSLTQSIGSLRWGKAPLLAAKEAVPTQRGSKAGKHRSTNSIGGMSVDSTVSLPAGVGRKPFK